MIPKGFSILELLTAILVLAVLAHAAQGIYTTYRARVHATEIIVSLRHTQTALQLWSDTSGYQQWPDESDFCKDCDDEKMNLLPGFGAIYSFDVAGGSFNYDFDAKKDLATEYNQCTKGINIHIYLNYDSYGEGIADEVAAKVHNTLDTDGDYDQGKVCITKSADRINMWYKLSDNPSRVIEI